MPREKIIKVGDFVFAKVRGYPAWPARVQSINDPGTASLKYTVFFFGTSETAVVTAKDIHIFVENRERFGKPMKRKYFNESMREVEEELAKMAIGETSTKGLFVESYEKGDEPEKIREPRKSVYEENAAPNTPDESLAKKPESDKDTHSERKRKRKASEEENMDEDNIKDDSNGDREKHRPKGAGSKSYKEGHASNQSQDKVSRSGRKIKRKKFLDESVPDGGAFEKKKTLPDQHARKKEPEGVAAKLEKKMKPENKQKEAHDDPESLEPPPSPIGRVVWVKAKCGQLVLLQLDQNRPSSFKDTITQLKWERDYGERVKKMKMEIETTDVLPEDIQLQLMPNPEQVKRMTKEELLKCKKIRILERKKGALRCLKLECKLIDLDLNLRTCLQKEPPVDPVKALKLMEEICCLPIDALILKKHPRLFVTMTKVRNYFGNVKNWGMSKNEAEEFNRMALKIREKSKFVLYRFRSSFAVKKSKKFWNAFVKSVNEFKRLTKNMNSFFAKSLTLDPTSEHFADYSLYYKEEVEFARELLKKDKPVEKASP